MNEKAGERRETCGLTVFSSKLFLVQVKNSLASDYSMAAEVACL